jgi:GNAT superfamily N-acetyltransferase
LGNLEIRNMTPSEVDKLVDWAAREGWNPGLHDADLFWATDSEAFIAADLDGEMIGGGAITSYDSEFGFMGFFIVRPEYRGKGLGDRIWHARRERLIKRLHPGATIGMDGVFEMQDYYSKGGFVFSHRDLRFCLEIPETGLPQLNSGENGDIVPLAEMAIDDIASYDRTCFPAARQTFLRGWIGQPDSLALGSVRNGRLTGFGVIRTCREGFKIGPLFSDEVQTADRLFVQLTGFAVGQLVYLDVPEKNPAALDLARKYEMAEVFGCARMYLGPAPEVAHQRIFGVTTFELG